MGITIPSGFPNIHDTVRNVIEASKEFQIKEAHKSTSLDDIMPILTPIVGSEMASIISRAANVFHVMVLGRLVRYLACRFTKDNKITTSVTIKNEENICELYAD